MNNLQTDTLSIKGGLQTKRIYKKGDSNLPLVTIITSVWNGGVSLEYTIESVLSQTYPNIEYIIIDGGSNDNTIDIIKSYESRIDYWISEKDSGIYDAWNKGIAVANGEWIGFIGADDIYKLDAIESMVGVAKTSKDRLDYISGRTELTINGKFWKISGEEWQWSKFKRYVCTGHNGALHNRNLFQTVGKYDTNFKSAGDYDLLLRLGEELKTGYTQSVTSSMAMGGVSNINVDALNERYLVVIKNGHTSKLLAYTNLKYTLFMWNLRKYLRIMLNK